MARIVKSIIPAALGLVAFAGIATAARAQPMTDAAAHERFVGAVLIDQLELRAHDDGGETVAWEAKAWYGGDYEKVFLRTQGEYDTDGAFERLEAQLLYSWLVGHFWDLQAGLRYDFDPDPSRAYGVIGLQGLAPGFVELDLQGFVSNKGDLSARLEAEYDLLITQRLVLQPKAELELAAQRERALGIGKGLNEIALGLRLRYELTRKFAPYLGIQWERKLGETARFARQDGEDENVLSVAAGVRMVF